MDDLQNIFIVLNKYVAFIHFSQTSILVRTFRTSERKIPYEMKTFQILFEGGSSMSEFLHNLLDEILEGSKKRKKVNKKIVVPTEEAAPTEAPAEESAE